MSRFERRRAKTKEKNSSVVSWNVEYSRERHVHKLPGLLFNHRSSGKNVKECERKIERRGSWGGWEGTRLTHAAVVHGGILNPALRLLDLSFQVNSGLCRPAVGHGFVGLGLQVLQRCCDLFSQSSGLGSVTFTPIRNLKTALRWFYHKDMAEMRYVDCQLQLESK